MRELFWENVSGVMLIKRAEGQREERGISLDRRDLT